MKPFLIVLFFGLLFFQMKAYSQKANPYKKDWEKVALLEKQGLYRSAWDVVNEIYSSALSGQSDQEQIKALIYQLKYRARLEENADVNNIRMVDSIASVKAGVSKAILQSMLAEMYLGYVRQHRIQLYNRISSAAENEDDLTTWSLPHFYDKITALYKASLQDETLLKQTKLVDFTTIIDDGKNTLSLQPTLFDLLAHRALSYFTGEEQYVLQPAQHFIINQPRAFSDPREFSETDFSSRDSASLQLFALHLYQQLIRFHLNDKNPDAGMDVNIQRLQFVYRKAVLRNKDSLYKSALERIIQGNSGQPAIAQASFLLADYYFQRASSYNPETHPENQFDLKKALKICDFIPLSPLSEGSINCRQLKNQILSSNISLEAERINIPDKPFRVLVKYQNAFHLYFRLIKLPVDPTEVVTENDQNNKLLSFSAHRQWEQSFPNPDDYRMHSAEMKIEGLPVGRYALMVSSDKSFSKGKSAIVSVIFFVSDISYLTDNKGTYLLVNRETGVPLPQAKIRLWETEYDYKQRKTIIRLTGDYAADSKGMFTPGPSKKYSSYMPEIFYKNDHLFLGQAQFVPVVSSSGEAEPKDIEKTFLFTDRSIYRPGQTIYFKGITFHYDPKTFKSDVVPDQQDTVYLYDANNQKVDSLSLTTDEFGSYAGSFILPKGSLNGQMHLETKDHPATNYFSVEEYKRPSFYMHWDTAAHSYSLNDEIEVKGTVMTYSGATTGGATVQYQVTRTTQIRFPFSLFGRGPVFPRGQEVSIAQGITTTNENGNFDIPFIAAPDEQTDSSRQPVFVFTVSVDVTDINGETHHFAYSLPLGYTSLQLAIDGNDKINLQQPDTLHIRSTNLSGRFVAAEVAVRLLPLQSPDRFIRRRYWGEPDEFILNKKDYLKYFPHDEYKNENDPDTWKKLPAVFEMKQHLSENNSVILPGKELKPGRYVIIVNAKDDHGRNVSATKYLQVYNPAYKKPAFYNPLWISKNNITTRPGQKVSWYLSSTEPVFVFEQTETVSNDDTLKNINLNNSFTINDRGINNSDRGGLIMNYFTVYDNRFYSETLHINIPWDNKKLQIHYETFRDKLLPGAKENWRVKITGEEGQKVSAELLSAMYDASLDAFRLHRWNIPGIYPTVSQRISWIPGNNFSESPSEILSSVGFPVVPVYEKIYPSLKWFGYSPAWGSPGRAFSHVAYAVSGAPAPQNMRQTTTEEKDILNESLLSKSETTDTSSDNLSQNEFQNIPARKNFNETAFFFPRLLTDKNGDITFSFTMPEALTRWKWMMFAHTKDMHFAYSDKEIITQKPFMIGVNAPRFVRQGDQLTLSARISNLSNQRLSGNAQLELSDALTGKFLNDLLKNQITQQAFSVSPGQSTAVRWNISIPENYTGTIEYKVVAASGDFSDGEQNAVPVLTNKAWITESLPLNFRGNGTHDLKFDVLNKLNSSSLLPLGMTLEYTGNPVWYAVQALPFLDADPLQSADVLYNRFYANALSGYIAKQIPDFHQIMETWLTKDTNTLKSPLQQNEQLKTVLIQETPWVQAGRQEEEQKSRIAHWFDSTDFKASLKTTITALQKLQLPNGGFTWFKGMQDNRYVTQQIISGLGHLKYLNVLPEEDSSVISRIVQKAVPYLDDRIKEDYDQVKAGRAGDPQIGAIEIQYLYARSFFPKIKMADTINTAYRFYQKLAAKQWLKEPPYLQAMIALEQSRSGDIKTARDILKSLSETAINDRDKGMYWKNNQPGYLWYEAPVEAQAICIEAFQEINHDSKTVSDLATWLLTQKETQHWATNRATADAVYALLLAGNKWVTSRPDITIQTATHVFKVNSRQGEAGTQYQQQYIPGNEITPAMAKVKVTIRDAANEEPGWGGLYFQYLENMNKVEGSSSPMQVERQISLEKFAPNGPELIPVGDTTQLKVGDKVQIRLIVKINENMDYVHLKDIRASCMEPLQTVSGYHFQDGTGYYFTVTDAAVHYYFSHLNKGTYVFTYPVFITQSGDFTGGLSTIECLYAPKFRAHSEGERVIVK